MRARRPCARRILDTGVDRHTCVIATVEAEVRSSSVGVVYVVRLRIVFSKAALQKRGSMEPMEPPLDPPLGGMNSLTTNNTHQSSLVCNLSNSGTLAHLVSII